MLGCPENKLKWYKLIILSTYVSGITSNAVSFSHVVTNLNNNESNNIYLSANVSTFLIAVFVLGNVFCARYKYKSLKYVLIKYPACISMTVTGKCVSLRTCLL